MTHSSNRLSRRSVLKVAGISLTALIGSSGVGAAQTEQNQQAGNFNYQAGYASASGRNSQATVDQRSEQTITQTQRARSGRGRTRQNQEAYNENVQVGSARSGVDDNGDPDNGNDEPIENGPAPLDPENGDNGPGPIEGGT